MERNAKVKSGIEKLQRIKTWQLIILLIIFGVIAATFLRLNSIGMVQRREAVIAADQVGDEIVVHQRLYDLQHYVSAHMNTSLANGVYLEASHSRAIQKWDQARYSNGTGGENIYKKAQEVCAPQFSSWSQAYIQCTTNELAKYPAADNPDDDVSRPSQATFIHNFSSPLWTPDFAGWSVLLVVLIALLIVIRTVAYGILSLLLRRRYKRV